MDKTLPKRQTARKKTAARPRPSAKALRALKRFALENRAPARWINGHDDPTVSE